MFHIISNGYLNTREASAIDRWLFPYRVGFLPVVKLGVSALTFCETRRYEHIPPAFVTALRAEGYDVTAVGGAVDLGSEDDTILDYARKENRVVLSEDSDFHGADPELDLTDHPGSSPAMSTPNPVILLLPFAASTT